MLVSMNNLASAYSDAGKPALAVPLLEEVLKPMKASFGPGHPNTVTTLGTGNLAGDYDQVKEFAKAEPLHRERLPLVKQQSGPESTEYSQTPCSQFSLN